MTGTGNGKVDEHLTRDDVDALEREAMIGRVNASEAREPERADERSKRTSEFLRRRVEEEA